MGICFLYGNSGCGSKSGVPEFTYTGEYEIVKEDAKGKNWRILFLTSGTLTIQKLKGAANGIDVWMCGGGGGGGGGGNGNTGGSGGGGGMTKMFDFYPDMGADYSITIGGGGSGGVTGNGTGGSGGTTRAFLDSAAGGNGGVHGGSGGSGGSGGGGAGHNAARGGNGGSNGSNGGAGATGGGSGSGVNTHLFQDNSLKIYCGGGPGGGVPGGTADDSYGKPNRGAGGAGGMWSAGGSGCSGVVAIRNKRG